MNTGLRFRRMYASLGWSNDDVAKFLQVLVRTVQLWVSGRVRVPYAAYKLLRLQLRYELPGEAWNGWTISAGRLYTPEGHELRPQDFTWWSMLARHPPSWLSIVGRHVGRVQEAAAGYMTSVHRHAAPLLQEVATATAVGMGVVPPMGAKRSGSPG